MSIRVIRPSELNQGEIEMWRLMQCATPAFRNPFLAPEFAMAAESFRPGARVAVLSDEKEITGFFPFEKRRLSAGVPIAAGFTDCQGLIHAPGADWNARALLKACGLVVWRFDHLVDGQRPFERFRTLTRPSAVINLSDSFESYYKRLEDESPDFCRNVARKERKLRREVGETRFVIASRDSAALTALLTWKSAQYRRTGQTDHFKRPAVVDFISNLFALQGAHFGGLLSVLYAGDIPVAAHFGLRCGPVLAHWFPAYDVRFSRYSPGLIMHLLMARDAAGIGVQLIDMGTGAMRYKDELKSEDIFVGSGVVATRSPLGSAHLARSTAAARARDRMREHSIFRLPAMQARKLYRSISGVSGTRGR